MGWFGPIGDIVHDVGTDIFHGVTGTPTADQKRDQQRMLNEQVKAYREQSEITRQEISRKQGEQEAAKRRINESQIRSLRRNIKAQGFLGSQATDQSDMNNKLGG